MKINQIVGEHKKGFKAKIYQKKHTVAPTKPLKANEIEHPGHVKEAQVTPATVSAVDANTGEVKLKNPDGTETNVAPDAVQKGPDGKLVTKVATAKPGDQINIEKEMEEEMAPGSPEYRAKVQSGEIKLTPAPMPTTSAKPRAPGYGDPGMAAPYTPNPRFKDPGMAAPSNWASKAKANESADDILLDKMLTIAGLR